MTEFLFCVNCFFKELYWSKKVHLEHSHPYPSVSAGKVVMEIMIIINPIFFQAPGDDWPKAEGKKVSLKESECWKGALSWAPG